MRIEKINFFWGAYLSDFGELHPNSSSPFGHCFLPSQTAARDTHLPLLPHKNASCGHSFGPDFWLMVHSSSEASLQSGRPSHTKYQLMHCPLARHWNVFAGQPVNSAVHKCTVSEAKAQSHRPSALQCVFGSAN